MDSDTGHPCGGRLCDGRGDGCGLRGASGSGGAPAFVGSRIRLSTGAHTRAGRRLRPAGTHARARGGSCEDVRQCVGSRPRTGDGTYLAAIDDRQPARLAWLDIAYDGRLSVTSSGIVALGTAPGVDARVVTGADLEAIVSLPDGRFVAVEEGHLVRTPAEGPSPGAWGPALLTFGADAVVTRVDPLPPRFAIGPEGGGLRSNQGLESLARTPDGRLIAGLEQPRYADAPAVQRQGRPFGGGAGGPSRLIEFVAEGDGWRAARQWVYPLPPTPRVAGFDEICNDGELGLTDLLALDQSRLLALERACLLNPTTGDVRNVVHLQVVDTAGAEDVSAIASLMGRAPRPVAKTLVLDFDTLIPRLPSSLARLDNFEALAFGPALPDGRRTLLVVSDDNFRPNQHFVVLLLAIDGSLCMRGTPAAEGPGPVPGQALSRVVTGQAPCYSVRSSPAGSDRSARRTGSQAAARDAGRNRAAAAR